MQIHQVTPKTKLKSRKIVGRGGRHGKTSGRGTKGQNARAGHKKRPEMRDIIKKLPKRRGYKFNSITPKPVSITLDILSKAFQSGATVSPKTLIDNGVLSKSKGFLPKVKILADGTLDKKLSIVGCTVSKGALAAIEKAGGSVAK